MQNCTFFFKISIKKWRQCSLQLISLPESVSFNPDREVTKWSEITRQEVGHPPQPPSAISHEIQHAVKKGNT